MLNKKKKREREKWKQLQAYGNGIVRNLSSYFIFPICNDFPNFSIHVKYIIHSFNGFPKYMFVYLLFLLRELEGDTKMWI